MLKELLQNDGFQLVSQGEEFPNGPTCMVEAFDIVNSEGEVDRSRDFATARMTGDYPEVLGVYALNSLVNETVAVTSGSGTIMMMLGSGIQYCQTVKAGDEPINILAGNGFQWLPDRGEDFETEIICEPPFTPEQYGYYRYDDQKKEFILIPNNEE